MTDIVWMHTARRIVEERSAEWVHPYTGAILDVPDENNLPTFTDDLGVSYLAVLLDLTTASMLDQICRGLSLERQNEFATYGLGGAVELGWQIAAQANERSRKQASQEERPNE